MFNSEENTDLIVSNNFKDVIPYNNDINNNYGTEKNKNEIDIKNTHDSNINNNIIIYMIIMKIKI